MASCRMTHSGMIYARMNLNKYCFKTNLSGLLTSISVSLSGIPVMVDASEELERFRREWQQEVKARAKAGLSSASTRSEASAAARAAESRKTSSRPTKLGVSKSDEEQITTPQNREGTSKDPGVGDPGPGFEYASASAEPQSALEHYEKAVEREEEGNLGDSLKHYRTAYKLDDAVDKAYRKKYFPPSDSSSKPMDVNPSNAAVTIPNTAHHSLYGPNPAQIPNIIASFQSSSILGQEPPTEASPAPPCPISSIPVELLVKIFHLTAASDPASFARLSQVCRRLAYFVATEDPIWRETCGSDSFGFPSMRYKWALTVMGRPLPMSIEDLDSQVAQVSLDSVGPTLPLSPLYPSYREMWKDRPRVRFNGCYISTVNYYRPGVAAPTSATWSAPVIIVTYYRYLRFFRDGSCISLLTTCGPTEVVHHLANENMHSSHASGLPSAVMNNALRGRWKLTGDPYGKEQQRDNGEVEEEGSLDIETEGADADRPEPKYTYKMVLKMKNARKSQFTTRNNKLAWMGYWSYNKLTDDWAKFDLKNDRPYLWSRVKSYAD